MARLEVVDHAPVYFALTYIPVVVGFDQAMNTVAQEMQKAIPAEFEIDSGLKTGAPGVNGKDAELLVGGL